MGVPTKDHAATLGMTIRMSPDFALFLSQDTLRLLIRVEDGWAELGQVSTTAPDMAERMADLRDLAQKRIPTGMTTKLVIPNDHIRYMTLEPGLTQSDVLTALDGATPYDVTELVVDHDTDASGTHVAAVTREFLNEAERFALDHGMSPVSFVAIPREGSFDREVFFGKTKGAERLLPGGAELGPESEPMTIVPLPEVVPAKAPAPLSFASGRMDATPADKSATKAKSEQAAVVTPPDASKVIPPKAAPAPAPKTVPLPPRVEEPRAKPPAEIAFASQSTKSSAPAPKDQPSPTRVMSAISKAVQPKEPITATPPKPSAIFASRAKPAPRAPKPNKSPVLTPNASTTKPVFAHRGAQPAPVAPPSTTPTPPARARLSSLLTQVGGTQFTQVVVGGVLLLAFLLGGWWILRQGSEIATDDISAIEAAAPALSEPAVPSAVDTPAPVATTPEPEPAVATTQTAAPTEGLTPLVVTPQVLSDDEARRVYAATGVWQKAPGLPVQPRAAQLDFARPVNLAATPQLALPAIEKSADSLQSDASVLTPPPPPPPDQRFVLDENGFIAATPEGAITPSGILVFAGTPDIRPPTRPGTEPVAAPVAPQQIASASGIQITAAAPPVIPPTRPGAAPATPEAAAPAPQSSAASAARPAVLPPSRQAPVAPETAEVATPEVATPQVATPETTTQSATPPATSGERPAVLPPSRRASVDAPVTAGGVSLAGLVRPQLRPEDLAPTPEELTEAAEPAEPISDLAVATSPRPTKRPRNIATLVASAQQAPPAQSTGPAVAQPLRPTAPTASTVAARATQDNVFRLSQVNLIGVYGTQRNRRAYVRLANGRLVKLGVGDQLDGGRVSAIGSDTLQYNRGGRRITLEIPGN